jgi:hypothetical protein
MATIAVPLALYHPFETTYFNSFAGGLRGATRLDLGRGNPAVEFEPCDYWGSSLRRCVRWVNANLPAGARVRFGMPAHVLRFYPLRGDLVLVGAGGAPPTGSDYVVFLRRPHWYGTCELYALARGTPVHSEEALGVELSSVALLPEPCNPCMPRPKCGIEPISVGIGGAPPVVKIDAGPFAAGRPFLVILGVSGFDPGTAVPWGAFERLPLNADALTLQSLGPSLGFPIVGVLDGAGRAARRIPLELFPERYKKPGVIFAVAALIDAGGAPLVSAPGGFILQP